MLMSFIHRWDMTDWLALFGILTFVAGLVRWAFRRFRGGWGKVSRFLDDFYGEPAREGVPERLGVMARMAISAQVQAEHGEHLREHGEHLREIKHEVLPNTGASLRDAVDRLEEGRGRNAARLDGHDQRLDEMGRQMAQLIEARKRGDQ